MNDNYAVDNKSKNRKAWIEVSKRLLFFPLCLILFSIAIVFVGSLILLNKELAFTIFVILGVVSTVLLLCIFLWFYKESVYEELHGTNRTSGSSWEKNSGNQPACHRVNVETQSGKVLWNVKPNKMNWDLNNEDPITEFMTKE
jgi:heme/copper-type cytochrome/quinol oxidase subunit 4